MERDKIDWVIEILNSDDLDFANWLIVRLLFSKDLLRYAIYAAEQHKTKSKIARLALTAAKNYLKSKSNADADRAFAASNAAHKIAFSKHARDAYSAAYAASCAAEITVNTMSSIYSAQAAAKNAPNLKAVIRYGIRLLKK